MSKQEESVISDEIKAFLNSKRIFNRRNQAVTTSYGLPDREFLYKGLSVGIEVKTLTGDAKEHQIRKLNQFNKNGGFGVVVRSVDEVKYIVDLIDTYWELRDNCGLDDNENKPWLNLNRYMKEMFDEYQKDNV